MITLCKACNQTHVINKTIDLNKDVVGTFCPIVKSMATVTTDVYNGVNVKQTLKAFIPLQVNLDNAHKLHDNSLIRISRKVAYELLKTPFGKDKQLTYYFVQYHAYNSLKEIVNKQKGLTV